MEKIAPHPGCMMAAEIALAGHERRAATGYPGQRACSDIPLSGRIVNVLDFPAGLKMGHAWTVETLKAQCGRAFDPAMVGGFSRHGAAIFALPGRVSRMRITLSELFNSPQEAP